MRQQFHLHCLDDFQWRTFWRLLQIRTNVEDICLSRCLVLNVTYSVWLYFRQIVSDRMLEQLVMSLQHMQWHMQQNKMLRQVTCRQSHHVASNCVHWQQHEAFATYWSWHLLQYVSPTCVLICKGLNEKSFLFLIVCWTLQ